jgi:hypothetical protein
MPLEMQTRSKIKAQMRAALNIAAHVLKQPQARNINERPQINDARDINHETRAPKTKTRPQNKNTRLIKQKTKPQKQEARKKEKQMRKA